SVGVSMADHRRADPTGARTATPTADLSADLAGSQLGAILTKKAPARPSIGTPRARPAPPPRSRRLPRRLADHLALDDHAHAMGRVLERVPVVEGHVAVLARHERADA